MIINVRDQRITRQYSVTLMVSHPNQRIQKVLTRPHIDEHPWVFLRIAKFYNIFEHIRGAPGVSIQNPKK